MGEILAVENNQLTKILQQGALNDRFLFTSPAGSILTKGYFQRLSVPLVDNQGRTEAFQQQIAAAFQVARAAGIDRPRLVGAIPFDAQQLTDLFIPQQLLSFERDTLVEAANMNSTNALAEVTARDEMPAQVEFMAMVDQAVQAMRRGELDKVVLSRLLTLSTRQRVDSTALIARVIAQNPDGYHFHLPLANGEVLAGASPELLLRKQAAEFSSCPLAGSARRQANPLQDRHVGEQLLRSTKDRHEHQLVIEAMEKVLAPLVAELTVSAAPKLVTTSKLWHLASEIVGRLAGEEVDKNALQLAGLLHPTPALSGFPHHQACQLIQQLEPFSRQLFGGMVGWCDDQGNGEWVVTIRCAQVGAQQVTLFAGAGIVAASDPLSEWNETGTKLGTMLQAFGLQ